MKRFFSLILLVTMLLGIVACAKNTEIHSPSTGEIMQNQTTPQATETTGQTENVQEVPEAGGEDVTEQQITDDVGQSETDQQPTDDAGQEDIDEPENTVFHTEDVQRITFYGYYGGGNGTDVPGEYLEEIRTWLTTFVIGEEAPEFLPPGTNTVFVELEYSDGSIVKQGMDTTSVDGVTYYIVGDAAPVCYREIISKIG